ncbi:proline-rich Akt substrate 40 kDa [Leptinotarsa decemlineata]|uniref:proline-rich Akt substrate 40 kDa n=1 Tax=Leptinotarsa decemlineata TaxID=7539 RepID=UPI003D30C235
MFSCFCLNILIEGTTEDTKVTLETLNLRDEEKNDTFFRQDIQQVKKLESITKIQASLVQARNVGQWTVNCCINCICEAYAVHKEKGASCVIINSKLMDHKSIDEARKSEDISKVFNIIVTSNNTKGDISLLKHYVRCDPEIILRNIRENIAEFLRKETLAVEERIKAYSMEQYEILNTLKDTAYEEHETIVSLVQTLTDQAKPACTKKPMAASEVMESSTASFKHTEQFSMKTSEKRQLSKRSPKRQKSSPAAPVSSFDAEGLFDFEGSDGVSSQTETDMDESDREESRESVTINRQRIPRRSIAKSLPMNIPAFMSQARTTSSDDLDDYPELDKVDIAASIKALAQSVHGDAVFGELPRPRFSTQI